MCRIHTTEELANILDTMADLFAWKRRDALAQAAAVARFPSQPWRHPGRLTTAAEETGRVADPVSGPGRPQTA